MPRIGRRHIDDRLLMSIRRVPDIIMQATIAVDPADADFANGKPDAVANII